MNTCMCYRLTNEFDKQVAITLNSTAKITTGLFPLQCFPLSEGEKFVVNFKHELQANTPGKCICVTDNDSKM